jgi:hypothetical protein
MCNLFAFRATDPRALKRQSDPVGPGNRDAIKYCGWGVTETGGAILAAWGNLGAHRLQGQSIKWMFSDRGIGVACLGLTLTGHPKHPLYLPKTAQPVPFVGDGGRLVTERRAVGQ